MFFNAAQVLPCYIIKLRDTGSGDKKTETHQLPPQLQKYQEEANTDNDDAKRKREKLLARVGQLQLNIHKYHISHDNRYQRKIVFLYSGKFLPLCSQYYCY